MEDDRLRDVMLGSEAEALEAAERARESEDTRKLDAQRARESVAPRDLDEADVTDDEIVGRTKQASSRTRRWIFAGSIAFVSILVAMTLYLMLTTGPRLMEMAVMAILLVVLYGLINAATWEGEDPLKALREIDERTEAKERQRRRQLARKRRQQEKQADSDGDRSDPADPTSEPDESDQSQTHD